MTSSVPPTAEPSPRAARSGGAKQTYLLTYNFVSTILWAAVLGRVVLTVLFAGWGNVYRATGDFALWTQLGAVAEVGHAAVGMWVLLVLWGEWRWASWVGCLRRTASSKRGGRGAGDVVGDEMGRKEGGYDD